MSEKKKYQFEFIINASPSMIYQYLTSASALGQWFADDVVYKGGHYVFIWGDSKEKAVRTKDRKNERVRFQWLDENGEATDYYTEFRIVVDELTKDVSLIITDFSEDDEEEVQMLWENQIEDLKQILGVH
jgi:uncharacterized protein YndB with AHSA1/START domain